MNIKGLIAGLITIVYIFAGAYIWVCPVKHNCGNALAAVAPVEDSENIETEVSDNAESVDSESENTNTEIATIETDDEPIHDDTTSLAEAVDVDVLTEGKAETKSNTKSDSKKLGKTDEVKQPETKATLSKEKEKESVPATKVEKKAEEVKPIVEASKSATANVQNPKPRKEVLYDDFPYHSVYFSVNDYNAKADNKDQNFFDKLKVYLDKSPETNILITGHADSSGIEMFNHELGLNRANTLKSLLLKAGIDASRITTKSYGELRPKASNTTEEGRTKNRRAEIIIEN